MEQFNKIREPIIGMILSFTSWEIWQNIIISLVIAFLGGFLAAAGKQLYRNYYERRKKKKGE
jgi:nucleoside recognition membrane protein YjiH